MNRLITLNNERLEKAKTIKGGYNAKQLQILDVTWPPQSGWKKDLIGTQISLSKFVEFVRLGANIEYLNKIEALLPTLNPPIKN
jgi:hypothetical protein